MDLKGLLCEREPQAQLSQFSDRPFLLNLADSPGETVGGACLGLDVCWGAMVRRCARAGVRRDVPAAVEEDEEVKEVIFAHGCLFGSCFCPYGAEHPLNARTAASAPGTRPRCCAQMPGCGRSQRASPQKRSTSTWSTITSVAFPRVPSAIWSTCGTSTCPTTASTHSPRAPCDTWVPSCVCWTCRITCWGRPAGRTLAPLAQKHGCTTTPGTVTALCRSWWRLCTWSPRLWTGSSARAPCGGWARGAGGKTWGLRASTQVSRWSNCWILGWTSAACRGRPPMWPCWWQCLCGSSW